MNIGFDVDGVLADFNTSFTKLIKEVTDITVTLPPKSWNYHTEAGVTAEQSDVMWGMIGESDTFWADLKYEPEAVNALKMLSQLAEDNHKVYFITDRLGDSAKRQTEEWLEDRIAFPTVLISGNKAPLAAGLKLDYIVDDKPDTLMKVKRHASTKTILVKRPYNEWAQEESFVDYVVNDALEAVQLMVDRESVHA